MVKGISIMKAKPMASVDDGATLEAGNHSCDAEHAGLADSPSRRSCNQARQTAGVTALLLVLMVLPVLMLLGMASIFQHIARRCGLAISRPSGRI